MRISRYTQETEARLAWFASISAIERIWDRDHTLWKPDPEEISNRLGWLDLPDSMALEISRLNQLAGGVRDQGIEQVILLGMGGSSLAPEVFSETFGAAHGFPELLVLDSIHPLRVQAVLDGIDLERSLFIVSSKSGSTVETLSLFKAMYARVAGLTGAAPGSHFLAITDPGSSLAGIAETYSFRASVLNKPDLGGRYSALSLFGLVPAALLGVDLHEIARRASAVSAQCRPGVSSADNPGAYLGAAMAEMALQGRDKLTLVLDPSIASFGAWIEQLVAESTGKEGRGILPVLCGDPSEVESYGDDRFFVWLRTGGDSTHAAAMSGIQSAGHPVLEVDLDDPYDLGGQFFLWEFATALTGVALGINPFDQPNVESAKVRTREMMKTFQRTGSLQGTAPALTFDGIEVFTQGWASAPARGFDSIHTLLEDFIDGVHSGGYIAIQAYLDPSRENMDALERLRRFIQRSTLRAVTLGIGPRFLHSTGQLHKGDAGHGIFLQLSDEKQNDVLIPDDPDVDGRKASFGVLIDAQQRGDHRALTDAGRRVLHLRLQPPSVARLAALWGA